MNSPYMGNFFVSQKFSNTHNGLDLVGLDSKEIHATVNGIVHYAGWENPNNHLQGFGQYVCIRSESTGKYYYYGHLSEIKVKTGDYISITDVIGIEGSTGHSTGSHLHYECRPKFCKGDYCDIVSISGIKNELTTIQNDGYITSNPEKFIQCPCCNKKFFLR